MVSLPLWRVGEGLQCERCAEGVGLGRECIVVPESLVVFGAPGQAPCLRVFGEAESAEFVQNGEVFEVLLLGEDVSEGKTIVENAENYIQTDAG